MYIINLLVTNGLSHHYHLDESSFTFRGVTTDFYFLSHLRIEIQILAFTG